MARAESWGEALEFWEESALPGPQVALVPGGEARKGSRVRLRPRAGGDVFDLALAGRVAVVEGVDHDLEGRIHLAVTLEVDPGRDLGEARQPGHRFFFAVDEVELIPPAEGEPAAAPRILVAGIGNIFLADDGFGVEVVRRLLERPLPAGVEVVDYGIRGLDLAYALQAEYAAVILVDAAPRGHPPGTLSLIEPVLDTAAERGLAGQAILEPHGMDPVRVLLLARSLGAVLPPVRLVACEPGVLEPAEGGDLLVALSEPVREAVGPALELIESLVEELRGGGELRGAREMR
jgi:hydrogenase maturation protease